MNIARPIIYEVIYFYYILQTTVNKLHNSDNYKLSLDNKVLIGMSFFY